MTGDMTTRARPPARPEPEIRQERVEEDGEVWRVWVGLDADGRPVAAIRVPERIIHPRVNGAMYAAFVEYTLHRIAEVPHGSL